MSENNIDNSKGAYVTIKIPDNRSLDVKTITPSVGLRFKLNSLADLKQAVELTRFFHAETMGVSDQIIGTFAERKNTDNPEANLENISEALNGRQYEYIICDISDSNLDSVRNSLKNMLYDFMPENVHDDYKNTQKLDDPKIADFLHSGFSDGFSVAVAHSEKNCVAEIEDYGVFVDELSNNNDPVSFFNDLASYLEILGPDNKIFSDPRVQMKIQSFVKQVDWKNRLAVKHMPKYKDKKTPVMNEETIKSFKDYFSSGQKIVFGKEKKSDEKSKNSPTRQNPREKVISNNTIIHTSLIEKIKSFIGKKKINKVEPIYETKQDIKEQSSELDNKNTVTSHEKEHINNNSKESVKPNKINKSYEGKDKSQILSDSERNFPINEANLKLKTGTHSISNKNDAYVQTQNPNYTYGISDKNGKCSFDVHVDNFDDVKATKESAKLMDIIKNKNLTNAFADYINNKNLSCKAEYTDDSKTNLSIQLNGTNMVEFYTLVSDFCQEKNIDINQKITDMNNKTFDEKYNNMDELTGMVNETIKEFVDSGGGKDNRKKFSHKMNILNNPDNDEIRSCIRECVKNYKSQIQETMEREDKATSIKTDYKTQKQKLPKKNHSIFDTLNKLADNLEQNESVDIKNKNR